MSRKYYIDPNTGEKIYIRDKTVNLSQYRKAEDQDVIDENLSQRIDNIEAAKFPNVVFVGEPLIVGSNVSQFTNKDYMIFPSIVDVRNKPFLIEFSFCTGSDVVTQQNILDSHFGIALAIQNKKGIIALSSNGFSWNIGQTTGSYTIEPNKVYHARLEWDGNTYKCSLSTDGIIYAEDMVLSSSIGPYPQTMYIGGSPDLFGENSSHPFGGIIDMDESKLIINGLEIWHGMDDPGLASRANVSLTNLDIIGENRFNSKANSSDIKEIIVTDENNVTSNTNMLIEPTEEIVKFATEEDLLRKANIEEVYTKSQVDKMISDDHINALIDAKLTPLEALSSAILEVL